LAKGEERGQDISGASETLLFVSNRAIPSWRRKNRTVVYNF
jgi:hypothetical protein